MRLTDEQIDTLWQEFGPDAGWRSEDGIPVSHAVLLSLLAEVRASRAALARPHSEDARPPGPPSPPDRCKCGAVSLWRNASPNARAYDGLTRIWHTRAKCAAEGAPRPRSEEPCTTCDGHGRTWARRDPSDGDDVDLSRPMPCPACSRPRSEETPTSPANAGKEE